MHKKLFAFGKGSLAMVLDAELRRPLGIDVNTLLNITRQGSRIVIERSSCADVPVVEPPRLTSHDGYDLEKLVQLTHELNAIGLSRQDFATLSHDGMGMLEFIGTASFGGLLSAVTIARLEAFLEKGRFRVRHDDAIAAVLVEFPDELHWPPLRAVKRR
jgi:hypothetical protein